MYVQNLKYNINGACIFHLILVGILSTLILPVKNRGLEREMACLMEKNLLSVTKKFFVDSPYDQYDVRSKIYVKCSKNLKIFAKYL